MRAKEFRFAVVLDAGEELRTDDGTPLGPGPGWAPEHLLLGGLLRCTLTSLRYHASRAAMTVTEATGSARALFTLRESDGRYAATEVDVTLDVGLEPRPQADALVELLAKAERDCFIGASLAVTPTYRWAVNGQQNGS